MKVRRYIDSMVRDFAGSRKSATDFGYPMGRARWEQASSSTDAVPARRGRPNQADDPELIRKVEAAFAQCSQPSSRVSWNADKKEWMLAPPLAFFETFCICQLCFL